MLYDLKAGEMAEKEKGSQCIKHQAIMQGSGKDRDIMGCNVDSTKLLCKFNKHDQEYLLRLSGAVELPIKVIQAVPILYIKISLV